jgi:hypothetical protein
MANQTQLHKDHKMKKVSSLQQIYIFENICWASINGSQAIWLGQAKGRPGRRDVRDEHARFHQLSSGFSLSNRRLQILPDFRTLLTFGLTDLLTPQTFHGVTQRGPDGLKTYSNKGD